MTERSFFFLIFYGNIFFLLVSFSMAYPSHSFKWERLFSLWLLLPSLSLRYFLPVLEAKGIWCACFLPKTGSGLVLDDREVWCLGFLALGCLKRSDLLHKNAFFWVLKKEYNVVLILISYSFSWLPRKDLDAPTARDVRALQSSLFDHAKISYVGF